jgi:ACS family tartrate transporter-like MFS transporter
VISCVGALGGFVGPYIIGFLTDRTGTYAAGTFFLVGSAVLAAFLMLLVKDPNRRDR